MITLCIENSAQLGSVALVSDGDLLVEKTFANIRGRGTALFETLAELVTADIALDRVVVGIGPGSYNALRASISAGWGIARARGVPVLGVCSLLGYDQTDYCVVGDARAGQWFFARVSRGVLADGPRLIAPSELLDVADAAIFSTSELPHLPDATIRCPLASLLTRHVESAGIAAPIYLKPPHITSPSPR